MDRGSGAVAKPTVLRQPISHKFEEELSQARNNYVVAKASILEQEKTPHSACNNYVVAKLKVATCEGAFSPSRMSEQFAILIFLKRYV